MRSPTLFSKNNTLTLLQKKLTTITNTVLESIGTNGLALKNYAYWEKELTQCLATLNQDQFVGILELYEAIKKIQTELPHVDVYPTLEMKVRFSENGELEGAEETLESAKRTREHNRFSRQIEQVEDALNKLAQIKDQEIAQNCTLGVNGS